MSVHVAPAMLRTEAKLVAPPQPRACEDRTFGLPSALQAGFFGLFLAYLGVMAVGFPHPEMVLPMAIFVIFTVAFYVVPMLWTMMAPPNASKAMTMGQLLSRGMAIHTGHCSGGAAVAQVLVLPVLILLWGVAVVAIAALV